MDGLLCLIPARGGSKTVRRKNLRTVGGKTLVEIAIRACQPHGRAVVSTDDFDIAAVAHMCGAEVQERPAELAGDDASIDDLVRHVRQTFDGPLLVYQPTVPQAACVLGAFLDEVRQDNLGATMGYEHRHLLWLDELFPADEQVRSNRQGENRWYLQEVGVRYYPPGCTEIDRCWESPLPLIDIDTASDLEAVRAGASSKRILFRVVCSKTVGSGHVRRCVQIADELQHHTIAFTPAGISDLSMLQSLAGGYQIVTDGWPADLIVNDMLDTYEEQMFELRFNAPVVALEDCGPGARHASLVINELYPAEGNTLCGPEWAVLRPVFTAAPPHRFDHTGRPRLLVSFGGTDPAGLTDRLKKLTGYAQRAEWDTVIVEPPGQGKGADLAGMLVWADLVVCSGGRTVWEAMACGTPAYVLAQNPRELSHSHLSPKYGVHLAGLGAMVEDATILNGLTALLGNRLLLAQMSERMLNVVDGKGVLRIAHRIEGLLEGL